MAAKPVRKNVGKYPLYTFIRHDYSHEPFVPPLHIHMAGNAHWIKGCYRRREATEDISIALVAIGNMQYSQDGRSWLINPGQAYVIRKECEITIEPGPARACCTRVIGISGSFTEAALHDLGLNSVDFIHAISPVHLSRLFKAAYSLLRNKPETFLSDSSALAMQILTECARSISGERYSPTVQKAVSYLKSRLSQNITRSQLCRQTGISAPHLSRLFGEQFGRGPIDYYIGLKMAHAKTLLASSNLSVKEIAASLGYDNQLYFSSEFKKRIGISPKFYRIKHGMSIV
jgi:AraC-like DNA-binding protein